MHLNLVHQRVKSKVKRRLIHRPPGDVGVRDGLIRGYTQQIHVCPWSLVRGPCSPLHVFACTHAL